VSITGPDVFGETGAEVEDAIEVLDEREEAVVLSCSRRTKWMRAVVPRKADWDSMFWSVCGDKTREIELMEECLQQSQ